MYQKPNWYRSKMNIVSDSMVVFTAYIWVMILLTSCTINPSVGFTPPSTFSLFGQSICTSVPRFAQSSITAASLSLSSSPLSNTAVNDDGESQKAWDWDKVTDEWELDCYSRPVLVDGKKKLWEILMTDSSGTMRICRALPSNK